MSEKPKHRAGPWEIDSVSLRNMGALEIKGIGWRGSRIVAVAQFSGGSEDPEVRANARLIKAAPELLEALEDIIEQTEKSMFILGADLGDSIRVFGKQAIAKAKGE